MFHGPPERTIGWFLAFNAVNYSFWPNSGHRRWFAEIDGKRHGFDDEAFGIMACLTRAMNQGLALDSPEVLLALDLPEIERIFAPAHEASPLPLLSSVAPQTLVWGND